jgi:endonuclease/exonuclease/phosphatase (EEP) superfamily protein YafD
MDQSLGENWGSARAVTLRPSFVRGVQVVALAYMVAIAVVTVLLAAVGERWWVTLVGLYMPRVVLGAPLPFLVAALWGVRSWRLLGAQAASLLLLLFPVLGLTLPSPAPSRKEPSLRVLSYNVNSTYFGLDAVVAEIDRHRPDVVLLQEIGSPGELATAMRARYPTVIVDGQFLTASRYAVASEMDPEKLPFHGRQRSPRFLEQTLGTPLGPVAFFALHPISPREELYGLRHGWRQRLLSGHIFSDDVGRRAEENAGLRDLQIQTVAEAASKEPGPVVLAGDTNLPGLSGTYRRYLSRFQDGFTRAGWGFGYTFPSEHNKRPWMRIDRIMANDALVFTGFHVGSAGPSDHLPVVADMQLR